MNEKRGHIVMCVSIRKRRIKDLKIVGVVQQHVTVIRNVKRVENNIQLNVKLSK